MPDRRPDPLTEHLRARPLPSVTEETFPRLVRPRVFAWLWLTIAVLAAGLVVVYVRYRQGSG